MELPILAGLGLLGSYFNANEQKEIIIKDKPIPLSQVPNGTNVYNTQRLDFVNEKYMKNAKHNYDLSQYPKQTNVVPTYYNQLGSLLNKTKLSTSSKYSDANGLYKVSEDLDQVYDYVSDRDIKNEIPNEIYKQKYYDRDRPLLDDVYNVQQFVNNKSALKIPSVARQVSRTDTRQKKNTNTKSDYSTENTLEEFVPDNSLLTISESLTDNSNSIKKILYGDKECIDPSLRYPAYRNMNAEEVPGRQLVDDEIARYPKPQSIHNVHLPPADYPSWMVPPERPTQSQSSFLSQFESQKYDSCGLPGASNDIYQTTNTDAEQYLEDSLSYVGGWTSFSPTSKMSYNVVKEDELTHDNSLPFFKERSGYGSNDLKNFHEMDVKKELFTGNLTSSWQKKQEIRPLFAPVANMSYVYGTPVRPEGEESRYIPSLYRQGEKLFDEIRVTPGLNLDYNEIGTQGYHDMVRVMPKTVDELRTKDNQKISYEGRIIEGLRGREGPVQAEVVSYKPDGFKITTEADLLPTSDVNGGPRTVDNFVMKEQNRPETTKCYAGAAFAGEAAVDKNGAEWIKGQYKYSTRQNFTLPGPLQKFAKEETAFNPNYKSYIMPFGSRAQISQNSRGNVGAGASGTETKMYSSYQDEARTTTKQTTVGIPLNNNVTAVEQSQGQASTFNRTPLRNTTKQTTVEIPLNNNVTVADRQQGQANTFNRTPLRNTTKQTTVEIPYNTNVTVVDSQQGQANTFNRTPLRNTTKQMTVGIPLNNNVTVVDSQQGQSSTFNRSPLRNTIKQTTVEIPLNNNVTVVDSQQGQANTFNRTPLRNTTKQTTVEIPYNTNVTGVDMEQGQASTFNRSPLRITTKQTTVGIPLNNNVTVVDSQQGQASTFNRSPLKNTIKQTTVEIPLNNNVTAVDSQQGQANTFNRTPLRNTTKQTTVEIPYNNNITAVNSQQGQADTFNRTPLRNTIKQTTVEIPYNTNVTAVEQLQGQASAFNRTPLRTTIKEQTIDETRVGNAAKDVNGKGYGYMATNFNAPNTNKQFTSLNSHVGIVEGDPKMRDYNGAYATPMNDQRESTQVYRPPTNSGVDIGPIKEQVNISNLVDDDNRMPGPMPVYAVNNQQDRLSSYNHKFINDNVDSGYYIDQKILKQLDTNPYNIPYFGMRYPSV
jgi:hypothetical protein